MTSKWTNFTGDHLAIIAEVLSAPGDAAVARTCPSCANPSLHWYSYQNPFRARSKITYVWCSRCSHFHGETTAIRTWDLSDPLQGMSSTDRVAMEADLDQFFAELDELWLSGDLPQVHRSSKPLRRLS